MLTRVKADGGIFAVPAPHGQHARLARWCGGRPLRSAVHCAAVAPPSSQPAVSSITPTTAPLAARPPARLQPLAGLAPAHLAQLAGVLTDIDDTLTRDGQIDAPALDALQQLAAAGVPVVAITGRPVGWSLPMVRAWPVAAIVAENGAVLLRRDPAAPGGVRQEFVADACTRAANQRRLQACAAAVLAQVPGATLAQDSAGRLTDIAVDHSEFAHLPASAIAQAVAVMQAHGLVATVSSIHINGWIGGHNKLSGARWAVQTVLGRPFDVADWVYVGDSSNDQLMFEHLPLTVGVANIARFVPQLQWLPSHVTQAERGAGFAELVQALLAASRAAP
jgi:HAD superfamily hydrolase (TIGR01484 family)